MNDTTQTVSHEKSSFDRATVLLLDDEVRIVETLRLILRPHYNVLTAINGMTALEILQSNTVHVIISDQRMPQMTGVEFLRRARVVSPASVRILLTGFSDLQAIIDSINDGEVFRFLNKPWSNTELLSVVQEAVEVARQLDGAPVVKASLADLAKFSHRDEEKLSASDLCTTGVVLVKTSNATLFEQIKRTQPQSVVVLHASTLDDALDMFTQQRVTVFIAHFESVDAAREEALAFKLLKRDMPALLTIALMHNADANEIIALINQGRLFRFGTLPCKAGQVGFFIQSALRQSLAISATPQLLGIQRAEAVDMREEGQKARLFARIGSICKRWLGAAA
ncbi:MAG: response regulator [Azoarcus sp.]|jgi:serine/threonine-protein kinase|nr:response regulator [Azoarcus sp.]